MKKQAEISEKVVLFGFRERTEKKVSEPKGFQDFFGAAGGIRIERYLSVLRPQEQRSASDNGYDYPAITGRRTKIKLYIPRPEGCFFLQASAVLPESCGLPSKATDGLSEYLELCRKSCYNISGK